MPDVTEAAVAELVDAGVLAYRNRDYKAAIIHLQHALDVEHRHWRAKIYLAMSLYHGGECFTAYRHLVFLRDNCPEPEICAKAVAAMAAMNAEMAVKAPMPEMTCTMKKPVLPLPPLEDDSDIEWVKNERD